MMRARSNLSTNPKLPPNCRRLCPFSRAVVLRNDEASTQERDCRRGGERTRFADTVAGRRHFSFFRMAQDFKGEREEA